MESYEEKQHLRIRAEISLDAVLHNFEEMYKNINPGTRITAVIKADAYGHGAVQIAELMEPVPYIWGFAVAAAEEAMQLRNAGVKKPILILGPVFPEDYEELISSEVRFTIMDYERAADLSAAGERLRKKALVHIAVDTGMTRIGFADREESVPEIEKILRLPGLTAEGIFTHFARADETDREPGMVQLSRYLQFIDLLEKHGISIPLHHASNSAGIIRMPEANLDMVRAGITIYGIYPSEEVEKDIVKLEPVMSLISHVSYVKEVPAGTEVSYGGTYRTEKPARIATIPAGYADGYPRSLSNKGFVLIRGKKAPILGRVCMDQMMVDVSDIPGTVVGDKATLLGKDGSEEITADLLGNLSGRFPYELVCDINKRVPRVYKRTGSI